MTIHPSDYEKPGTFYLGREYDVSTKTTEEKLVLYDSKDLVTHGVVLGMTGSGKTGLCFALLEEAAMDNIPSIIIDPKGDIANFLLTFPDLTAASFRPWINEEDAAKKHKTPDEFAAAQAALWEKGLGEWGQSAERIRTLREKVDINIFTPGSNAGIPVSILASLAAPEFEIIDDHELFSERIETTASSILGLIGITADPINSRDHILLSNIFDRSWRAGENLDLEKIINYILNPPFAKIGVIDLEIFYPEKKRSELAMGINNLLASPGFNTWLTGEALDIKRLLHTGEGQPRVSIFSIAHLNDSERMFFVSLLLNQVLGWMRAQSGTTSLRALLYMDEIYGYLPPTANPPSKKPLMILLKQSRAFGLGLLVATQNPVDLDYKALSNIGTWFLGRLQTERDKARVLDGLEGPASSQGSRFDRASMEKLLSALGNRIFLMNNVHEDGPCVFQVRWVMSYLRGPLTRTQIKKLMDPKRASFGGTAPEERPQAKDQSANAVPEAMTPSAGSPPSTLNPQPSTSPTASPAATRPALPSSVSEYFIPVTSPSTRTMPMVYLPAILRTAEITFSDAPKDVFVMRRLSLLSKLSEEMITLDAAIATRSRLDAAALGREPLPGPVTYAALPPFALKAPTYTAARDQAVDWLYNNETIDLWFCEKFNLYSKPGEPEGDFRVRLQHRAKEDRDREIESLRLKYQASWQKLETAANKARAAVEREAAQARTAKISTAVNIGQTILGALFGRKTLSRTTISKSSTAARSATRAFEQSGDVGRAQDRLAEIEGQMIDLKNQMDAAMTEIRMAADPDRLVIRKTPIRALKKNIAISAFGLAWLPYYQTGTGAIEAAWDES